jgi:hypothetical protein
VPARSSADFPIPAATVTISTTPVSPRGLDGVAEARELTVAFHLHATSASSLDRAHPQKVVMP